MAPLALTPRNFIEQWIALPWPEAARWISGPTATLHARHKRLHDEFAHLTGSFAEGTARCSAHRQSWQVGIESGNPLDPDGKKTTTWLRVHWRKPHDFSIAAIGDHAWKDCDDPDEEADIRSVSLFPPGGPPH